MAPLTPMETPMVVQVVQVVLMVARVVHTAALMVTYLAQALSELVLTARTAIGA